MGAETSKEPKKPLPAVALKRVARRKAMGHVPPHPPQLFRICGRTVCVYKGSEGHSHGVHWHFYLAGRDPVGGFRTRKAALEQARKSLGADPG